jgi:hypothetical protein
MPLISKAEQAILLSAVIRFWAPALVQGGDSLIPR